MRPIYTFGGERSVRNLTLPDLRAAKAEGRTLSQSNASNAEDAAAIAATGVDLLSVASFRYDAARAAAPEIYTIAALGGPDLVTADDVLREAFRVASLGADGVYTIRSIAIVEMLAKEGIAVQGHVGLVPRKSILTGGLRAMGKTAREALAILDDVRRLEDAGAVAVEVECVAAEAMAEISAKTALITHTIGSGSGGDVVFLFCADICGDNPNPPRHARSFGDVATLREAVQAEKLLSLKAFAEAVRGATFPLPEVSVAMEEGEHARLQEALDNLKPLHL